MKEIVRRIFERVIHLLNVIMEKNFSIEKNEYAKVWKNVQGDKSFRLDYDLDETSLVFDLGGYEGQWTSDIFSKYCCTIYIFEPILDFVNKIEKRFSKNKKIYVFKFGISNENEKAKISFNKDYSSVFQMGKEYREANFVRAVDFINENNIDKIDLMKINIEGGEYDLLEDLIQTEYIKKIKNIQVQFHKFIPDAELKMKKIQNDLKKTHFLTYQYPFIWENWQIKE